VRRIGDYRFGLLRRMFPPNPPYQRHGRRGFRLRQQRRPDEVLELLREIRVTQEYVGPKRASMIRVDHHRTPVLSQHQLGHGQLGNARPDFVRGAVYVRSTVSTTKRSPPFPFSIILDNTY